MNLLPYTVNLLHMAEQSALDSGDFTPWKTVILSNGDGAGWTVETEHGLRITPDDVDMSGTMIVRVNYHSQSAQPQDCRHSTMVA
jgi:hypothetical protein